MQYITSTFHTVQERSRAIRLMCWGSHDPNLLSVRKRTEYTNDVLTINSDIAAGSVDNQLSLDLNKILQVIKFVYSLC